MLADIGLKGVLPAVPYRVVNGHIYLHLALRLRPWNLAGVVRDFRFAPELDAGPGCRTIPLSAGSR